MALDSGTLLVAAPFLEASHNNPVSQRGEFSGCYFLKWGIQGVFPVCRNSELERMESI